MKISFNSSTSYIPFGARSTKGNPSVFSNLKNGANGLDLGADLKERIKAEKEKQAQQLRESLRRLKQIQDTEKNPFAVSSKEHEKGLLELSATKDEDKKKHKPVKYNSKEVETKIQQAKTSTSAGLAVISAKRKVSEVQRKISAGEGDPEELQLTLTHARRMELVARKKKHHLEMEELVQTTLKRDDRMDQEKETFDALKDSMVMLEEEKLTKKENQIFEERQEQIEEAVMDAPEELLAELNEQIAQFGEEELRELEEAMEMLEEMEVVDPHMSKEELDELKRKHRAAEQKAMLKADMDYLKGMIKMQTQKGNMSNPLASAKTISNMPTGGLTLPGIPEGGMTFSGLSMTGAPATEGNAIDIQI